MEGIVYKCKNIWKLSKGNNLDPSSPEPEGALRAKTNVISNFYRPINQVWKFHAAHCVPPYPCTYGIGHSSLQRLHLARFLAQRCRSTAQTYAEPDAASKYSWRGGTESSAFRATASGLYFSSRNGRALTRKEECKATRQELALTGEPQLNSSTLL